MFNIRGATNIKTYDENNEQYSFSIKTKKDISEILESIKYSEEDFRLISGTADNENAKGVVQFSQEYC